MSSKAFVLIETAVGKTREVVDIIKKKDGVESVNTVTGPFDIIAVIKRDSLSDIGDLVTSQIHIVEGVSRTVTCLVI